MYTFTNIINANTDINDIITKLKNASVENEQQLTHEDISSITNNEIDLQDNPSGGLPESYFEYVADNNSSKWPFFLVTSKKSKDFLS